MVSCCIDGCRKRSHEGYSVTFHSFPKDPIKRQLWLTSIRKDGFVPKENSRVCSKHFTKKDYDRKKFGGTWLKPNAIPKLFNVSTNSTTSRSLLFPLDMNITDEETTSSSSSSNLPSSPVSERAEPMEDIRTSQSSSSSSTSERTASVKESTSSALNFKSLLTPIERNVSTEELYKSGASSLGISSRRTSLFRLTKRYVPNKVEIKDSSIAKHIKENDTKHIRYLEFLSNSKGIDDETCVSSSIRWEIAKQQKDLERRMEVAQKEKYRLKKCLKSVRRKTQYMRQLNAALKARLGESEN